MAAALRARDVYFEEVDVDTDPALEERYGELVPVLTESDGTEVCHYRLDENALRKALLK